MTQEERTMKIIKLCEHLHIKKDRTARFANVDDELLDKIFSNITPVILTGENLDGNCFSDEEMSNMLDVTYSTWVGINPVVRERLRRYMRIVINDSKGVGLAEPLESQKMTLNNFTLQDLKDSINNGIPNLQEQFGKVYEEIANEKIQLSDLELLYLNILSMSDRYMVDYYHIVELEAVSGAKLMRLTKELKSVLKARRIAKNSLACIPTLKQLLAQNKKPVRYTYRTGLNILEELDN